MWVKWVDSYSSLGNFWLKRNVHLPVFSYLSLLFFVFYFVFLLFKPQVAFGSWSMHGILFCFLVISTFFSELIFIISLEIEQRNKYHGWCLFLPFHVIILQTFSASIVKVLCTCKATMEISVALTQENRNSSTSTSSYTIEDRFFFSLLDHKKKWHRDLLLFMKV